MEIGEYQRQYEVERDHWWFQGMRDVYRTLLRQVVGSLMIPRSTLRILDIGCGAGWTSQWLQQFGQVVPMDISAEALVWATKRQLSHCVQGNAEQLPFRNQSFDLVAGLGVIEHLVDDQAALREMARVCRPGGWLLLLTSAYQFLWSHHDRANHHQRRYTATQLNHLVRAERWKLVRLSYANTCLFPAIATIRLFQRLTGTERRALARDLAMPPRWLNAALKMLLRAEARWLCHGSFPFGVSLVCLAKRCP